MATQTIDNQARLFVRANESGEFELVGIVEIATASMIRLDTAAKQAQASMDRLARAGRRRLWPKLAVRFTLIFAIIACAIK
jgi:hypothetical protein